MNTLKEGSEYSVEMEEQEAISFEENENEIYDFSNKISINHILHAELTSRSNGLQSESLVSSLVSGTTFSFSSMILLMLLFITFISTKFFTLAFHCKGVIIYLSYAKSAR